MFLPRVFAQENGNVINIGVISPKEGSRMSSVGGGHEDAIRLAFNREGPIRVGGREINIQIIGWNDRSDPEEARSVALQLADEENAAAILGPVNSGSTVAALSALSEAGIAIPVISQSSAPVLGRSGQRDPNFFRMTSDDNERMATYATFIEAEKRGERNQSYVFLYENDVYGRGLAEALSDYFYTPNVVILSWCEAVQAGCSSTTTECINEDPVCESSMLRPESYPLVGSGNYFASSFLELINGQGINNVMILGSTQGAISFTNGLEKLGREFQYFTVGNTKQLFDELPTGTIIASWPSIDPERAPTPELNAVWNEILVEFEQTYSRDRTDFYSTAYEAGMVMHTALRTYLTDRDVLPPLDELREGLINILETQTFGSLEPWRRIRFSDGSLDVPPVTPILRIARNQTREDPVRSQDWISVNVFPQFGYLESPISVEFESAAIGTAIVTLSRMINGIPVLEEVRTVDFTGGQAATNFHVLLPGTYRIGIDGLPYSPIMAETRVTATSIYLVAAFVAFLGALIVLTRDTSVLRTKVWRLLLGVAAGILFAFVTIYTHSSAEWVPVPSFGEAPLVNAVILGLVGGLIGPHLLPEIFIGWGTLLTHSIKRPNNRRRRRTDLLTEDYAVPDNVSQLNSDTASQSSNK
jgi:ABC-type branched-subunit amino acid transport system substrate-binding protein